MLQIKWKLEWYYGFMLARGRMLQRALPLHAAKKKQKMSQKKMPRFDFFADFFADIFADSEILLRIFFEDFGSL